MDPATRQRGFETFERTVELPMMVLALLILPLLIIPLTVDLPRTAEWTLFALDWVIWAAFAIELGIKTYLAPNRRRYRTTHWMVCLSLGPRVYWAGLR